MEVKISIHDLEAIHKALKHYLGTFPDWPYPYNADVAKDLVIRIHGAIEDYNYQSKNPDDEE